MIHIHEVFSGLLQFLTKRTICACMVTSNPVVGSSANTICGEQISPLAIMARCSIPPRKLMRVLFDTVFRIADPYLFE